MRIRATNYQKVWLDEPVVKLDKILKLRVHSPCTSRFFFFFFAAVVYLHTIKGLTHNILSSHAIFLTSNGKAKVSKFSN